MANPFGSESPHWQAAMEHYHWDRLEEAFGEVQAHGIGEGGGLLRWYRAIEAETVSRRKSIQIEVAPWLTFEYIPEEVMELGPKLAARLVAACDAVAQRLAWTHSERTLVSVLAEEVDAPWAAHPYGYCVSKEPYEKICLPNYLVDDLEEFGQAVAHEYGHVISSALADGYAPRWLEEAISVLLERDVESEAWDAFRTGRYPWLTPNELELALEGTTDETDDGDHELWRAYQQAGLLGRYLVSLGEERRLGDLLRQLADESFWRNLRLVLTGKERVDGALRRIYGFDANGLFQSALHWVCQTHD